MGVDQFYIAGLDAGAYGVVFYIFLVIGIPLFGLLSEYREGAVELVEMEYQSRSGAKYVLLTVT